MRGDLYPGFYHLVSAVNAWEGGIRTFVAQSLREPGGTSHIICIVRTLPRNRNGVTCFARGVVEAGRSHVAIERVAGLR